MSYGWDYLQLHQASRSQAAGCQTDISRVSHFLLLDAKDNEKKIMKYYSEVGSEVVIDQKNGELFQMDGGINVAYK